MRNPFARDSFQEAAEARRYWIKGMGLVLLISFAMLALELLGLLRQWEMIGLDTLLRHNASTLSDKIHIVEISDEDYEGLFKGQSPLNPSLLKTLIVELAKGSPAIIGIDLDVRGSSLPQEVEQEISKPGIPGKRPAIVWAQITDRPRDGEALTIDPERQPVRDPESLGVPLFPLDSDGIVRRYARDIPVREGNAAREVEHATLPWRIFERVYPTEAAKRTSESHAEDLIFNFTGNRYVFTITDASGILDHAAEALPDWRRQHLLQNKIVLLGGDYGAARDVYTTPVGERAGVELIAYAIESERRGGGSQETPEFIAFAFDVALGALLVFIGSRYRPMKALLFSAVTGLFLPLYLSFWAFRTFGFWFSFIPVVLGIMLHELSHHAEEGFEAAGEVAELKKEIAELKHELSEVRSAEPAPPSEAILPRRE